MVFILIKRSEGRRHLHGELYRDFPQRLFYLCHSANAEDTILAGGSAASPKAPPLRFFVESNATDHQEVSSFFFR